MGQLVIKAPEQKIGKKVSLESKMFAIRTIKNLCFTNIFTKIRHSKFSQWFILNLYIYVYIVLYIYLTFNIFYTLHVIFVIYINNKMLVRFEAF